MHSWYESRRYRLGSSVGRARYASNLKRQDGGRLALGESYPDSTGGREVQLKSYTRMMEAYYSRVPLFKN